jgi:hypothetical protein
MGYATEFEGRFHCYRPENPKIGIFLESVRSGDRTAVSVLADWLQDCGDPRGAEVAALVPQLTDDLTPFWQLFGLGPRHAAYLKQFSQTRRMRRDAGRAALLPDPVREAVGLPPGNEGGYFVGGGGVAGQDQDASILDYNTPPAGQPALWCRWMPDESRTAIVWNRREKFYSYVEWLEYLIHHFLTPWGYVLDGKMTWQGEQDDDHGTITVSHNRVEARADKGNADSSKAS